MLVGRKSYSMELEQLLPISSFWLASFWLNLLSVWFISCKSCRNYIFIDLQAEVPPFDVNASTSPFLVRNPSESYGPYSPVAPAQHNVVLPPMGNVSPSGSNPISPAAGPHHLMDMDAATCAISAMEGPPVDVPDELPFPQIPPRKYLELSFSMQFEMPSWCCLSKA